MPVAILSNETIYIPEMKRWPRESHEIHFIHLNALLDYLDLELQGQKPQLVKKHNLK